MELEHLNSELERRIDTWAQTTSVPANINLSFKVETMTYSKSGYIVKEEPLDRFLADVPISFQHLEESIKSNPSSLAREERRKIGF